MSESNTQSQSDELETQVHQLANLNEDPDPETSPNQVSLLAWIVVIAGLFLGILLTLNVFRTLSPKIELPLNAIESSTPKPSLINSPTPTSRSSKTRSDLKIHVLNGSGVPGAASVAKTYLNSLGYTSVDIGNANIIADAKTTISVRPGFPELAPLITSDLKSKYQLSAEIGDLPVTGKYDIEIILAQ